MGDHRNLDVRGLEAQEHGLAPLKSLDMSAYSGSHIPTEWDITGVTGNILMVEYADTTSDGEYVMRDGILINSDVTEYIWRVGRIIIAGPAASAQATKGAYVMFPHDKGIPLSKFNGHNYIFLNEERIFAFVEPKEVEEPTEDK